MKNANNIILSYFNVNSIMNILDDMKDNFSLKIDIPIISEETIDDSFLRLDKNAKNESLLFYVKSNLSSRIVNQTRIFSCLVKHLIRDFMSYVTAELIVILQSCFS